MFWIVREREVGRERGGQGRGGERERERKRERHKEREKKKKKKGERERERVGKEAPRLIEERGKVGSAE